MKYKLSEHKDEIITHIIKNVIWLPVAAAITTGIALIKNLLESAKSSEKNFITTTNVMMLLSILIAILLFCLLKIFITDRIKNQKEEIDEAQKKTLSSKFRAKSMEAELCFDSREKLTSKITYNMTALTSGIKEIERPITWSGSTYIKTYIEGANGDYTLVDSKRKFSPHHIKILFNPEKSTGDFVKFTTVTLVGDENHEMSPHYSFMVKYQIDELILHIVAPANIIRNVKKVVYADTGREILVEKPELIPVEHVGNLVRYTFKIPNPTFLYNYFIEWEFTN